MLSLRRFSNRLPLMAASVCLAFFLWILVIAEEKIEAGFMVPLVFNNIPPSVVIDGTPLGSVYVQIRGSKQAVSNVLPQQIRAHVDLSEARPGDEFIQITAQDIFLPPGITVLGVYPPYLDLKFLARKPVPVQVRTTGKPAEGYEVKAITAIPLQVEIVGPPERVKSIKEAQTYPVDIAGLRERQKVRVELLQPGDDIRLLQLKPTEVLVEIEAKVIEKTFRKVPIRGVKEGVEITPRAVTIKVSGSYHQVKELEKKEIEVLVDWEATGPDPSVRLLKTSVPPGLSVISSSPNRVKIK
jgi:YbbR domain-containing protein